MRFGPDSSSRAKSMTLSRYSRRMAKILLHSNCLYMADIRFGEYETSPWITCIYIPAMLQRRLTNELCGAYVIPIPRIVLNPSTSRSSPFSSMEYGSWRWFSSRCVFGLENIRDCWEQEFSRESRPSGWKDLASRQMHAPLAKWESGDATRNSPVVSSVQSKQKLDFQRINQQEVEKKRYSLAKWR